MVRRERGRTTEVGGEEGGPEEGEETGVGEAGDEGDVDAGDGRREGEDGRVEGVEGGFSGRFRMDGYGGGGVSCWGFGRSDKDGEMVACGEATDSARVMHPRTSTQAVYLSCTQTANRFKKRQPPL